MLSNKIMERIEEARARLHIAFDAKASPEAILRLSQELDVLIVEAYRENPDLGFREKSKNLLIND